MEKLSQSSFWTELFGRFWFDYERRFFPVNPSTIITGRVAYLFGVLTTFLLSIATIRFVIKTFQFRERSLSSNFFGISCYAIVANASISLFFIDESGFCFAWDTCPALSRRPWDCDGASITGGPSVDQAADSSSYGAWVLARRIFGGF